MHPEFIAKEVGLLAFPPRFRIGLKKLGIQYFLKLDIQQ